MRINQRNMKSMLVRYSWTPITLAVALLILFYAPISVAQNETDLTRMKEEIKREILQELRQSVNGDTSDSEEIEALKEQLKREILQELLKEVRMENELPASEALDDRDNTSRPRDNPNQDRTRPKNYNQVNFPEETSRKGIAEGRILLKGIGLPECDVKLVLMKTKSRATNYLLGREFVTKTDATGNYEIKGLIPGGYKLKWQLPNDPGWIRRLRDRPDALIEAGERVELSPVETARQLATR